MRAIVARRDITRQMGRTCGGPVRFIKWFLALCFVLLVVVVSAAVFLGPPKVAPEAIAASVTRTPELMERAWQLPVAASIGRDMSFQKNGSLCGPTSLANVFRSQGLPYESSDAVLETTKHCATGICFMGLTLDELASVARDRGATKVEVHRDLTPEQFQAHLRRSNDASARYVVNFHRSPIFGAGGGHHSPIGGYLEGEDLVFVLDVNADFQPWLVERDRLFAAIDTVDSSSGQKRGLLRIE
jgi:hypothetical protein